MGTGDGGRILYFNHDNPEPAGGVRTIYAHVAHLNRNGIPAFVMHRETGFRPNWFPETVPTLYSDQGLHVTSRDVLVFPEDMMETLEQVKTAPLKKIVFCQNHFYAYGGLPPGETWRSLGATHVIAASEVIAEFVRENLGWSGVPVVHYAVDHRLFRPGEKKLQIAYMPRKRSIEASFIRGLFSALGGRVGELHWVAVDGMPAERVAEILGESAIFLSLSHLEGFGLPPLEAMACGCAVVGYHGYGGLEYATAENGFWCAEEHPGACFALLRSVSEMLVGGDARLKSVVEGGIRTAERYTAERQEREIVQFMRGVMAEI